MAFGVKVYKNSSFRDKRGYYCLSDECLLHYKLAYKGKYADVGQQFSLKWNDPKLNIKWPLQRRRKMNKLKLSYIYSKPILSKRDSKL